MEPITTQTVENLALSAGIYPSGTPKKRQMDSWIDFNDYRSDDAQVDEASKIKLIMDLAVAMNSMGLITNKELKSTIIMGPQSSGKSSFLNVMMSLLLNKDVCLAPSAQGRTTKNPLFVDLYSTGAESQLELVKPGDKPLKGSSFDELRKKLKLMYQAAGEKVTFTDRDGYRLRIRCEKSLSFVDTPGPFIPPVASTEEKASLWANYFESIISMAPDRSPLIVALVKPSNSNGSLDSEPFIMAMQEDISKNPGRWSGCSILILITHIDTLGYNDYGLLVSSCRAIERSWKELKQVRFAITQSRVIKDKVFNPDTQKEKITYETPLVTIQKEKEKWPLIPILRDALSETGEPLFYIGAENIANLLIMELGKAITTDKKFLASLCDALDKKINTLTKQIAMIGGNSTFSSIGVNINPVLQEWNPGNILAAKLSLLIGSGLRKKAEDFFTENLSGKSLYTGTVENPHGSFQVEKFVEGNESGKVLVQVIKQFLDYLSACEKDVVYPAAELYAAVTQEILSPYFIFKSVEDAMKVIVSTFKDKKMPVMHEEIATFIRQTKYALPKPTLNVDHVIGVWGEGSKFVQAAKFDQKDKAVFERDVLLHMHPLLKWIEKQMVMKLMTFRGEFADFMGNELAKNHEVVPEMTPYAMEALIKQKDVYETGRRYIRTFQPDEAMRFSINTPEPGRKKTRIEQAWNVVTSLVTGK